MGVKHASEAYRTSAYQAAEYQLEYRVNSASIPVVGGIGAAFKLFGNGIARPFKVVGAFLLGTESSPAAIAPAAIPADLKDSKLGEDLGKAREIARQAADIRTDAVGKLLSGSYSEGFRKFASARHIEAQAEITLFPDEVMAGGAAATSAVMLANAVSDIGLNNPNARDNNMLSSILDSGPGGRGSNGPSLG